MWVITFTPEYEEWFCRLDFDSQIAIRFKTKLLAEFGPQLSRPHADTLKGSCISNLKELRVQTLSHVFRIAYCFNPERKAFILTAGDKKGKNAKKFYKTLIANAEELVKKYDIVSLKGCKE